MSGQTTLGRYFNKRTATAVSVSTVEVVKERIQPSAKRARTLATLPTKQTTAATTSSPKEQQEWELPVEEGWKKTIGGEAQSGYFKQLNKFLQAQTKQGRKMYPPKHQIFAAFNLSPWDSTRVVIIGQDPYHGPDQANGLAFSVNPNIKIPPSLRNIFKEAGTDVGLKKPEHGTLEPWAKQGVLLLNTVLTVTAGQANSHKKRGWEQFTDAVIRKLNKEKEGLVFLLWGKPAQKKAEIVNRKRHHVIMSSHPSPLGATKTNMPFIGSKCFSRANAYLEKTGQKPIDWTL